MTRQSVCVAVLAVAALGVSLRAWERGVPVIAVPALVVCCVLILASGSMMRGRA